MIRTILPYGLFVSHIRILIIQLARLNVYIVWWYYTLVTRFAIQPTSWWCVAPKFVFSSALYANAWKRQQTVTLVCVCQAQCVNSTGWRVLVVLLYLLTRLSPTFGRKKLYNIHLGLSLWADWSWLLYHDILTLSNVKWLLQKPSWCWPDK
jgi:hypothetical protein